MLLAAIAEAVQNALLFIAINSQKANIKFVEVS
jgi:hypothetical protein